MLTMENIRSLYEPVSSLSHFVGGVCFLIFSIYVFMHLKGQPGKKIAVGIYSAATVFTLFVSGIYHVYGPEDELKLLLQKLDHTLIFLLIVGTITPIHQIMFKGFLKWTFIIITWVVVVVSIVIKLLYFEEFPEWLGTLIFIILGWGGAITTVIIWRRRNFRFVKSLIIGGVVYTIGAVMEYYRFPVIVHDVFEAHELFHFLVIIGLAYHWKFVCKIAVSPEEWKHSPEDEHEDQAAA